MSDFDFSQFERLANNYNNATKDLETFLKKFLLEMAFRVIAKVKLRTPVDTGALRAMWGIGSQNLVIKSRTDSYGNEIISLDEENSTIATIDMIGNNFEILIWNGMDYASFIEFGARNRDGSWRQGYFMMTISIDEVNRQMPLRFDKAWKQFLSERGIN